MMELQQSVVSVLKEVQTTLSSLEQTLSAQNVQIQVCSDCHNSAMHMIVLFIETTANYRMFTFVLHLKVCIIQKQIFTV